jgi:hypothetical protein
MVDDLVLVIGTLGGVLVGSLVTFGAAKRVSAHPPAVTPAPPADTGEKQLRIQLEAEAKRRRLEKIDDSYGKLLGWLYELEVTTDGVRLATWSKKPDVIHRSLKVVEEWPWQTLRPPRYVASTQHYWSDDVRALVDSFYRDSAPFISSALIRLARLGRAAEHDRAEDDRQAGNLDEAAAKLRKTFARIREQVRRELDLLQSG